MHFSIELWGQQVEMRAINPPNIIREAEIWVSLRDSSITLLQTGISIEKMNSSKVFYLIRCTF